MEYVNEIIDNLCTRLGTTAEMLIPEYAKMRMATSATSMIITVIVFAVVVVFIVKGVKRIVSGDWYEDGIFIVMGIVLILGIFAAFIFLSNLNGFIAYSTSPTAAFVNEMLRNIK